MSATTIEKTVRDLALENPRATRVFEKFQIDYCCGGGRSLADACRVAGVEPAQVIEAIESEAAAGTADPRDWSGARLGELIDFIRDTNHVYTREAIERIPQLIAKVVAAHGANHPEVLRIQAVFGAVAEELTVHMMKEEMVLFPYIARMEEAAIAGEPALPAPFGTVGNPIRMMEHEHESAGEALREMRALSNGYTAPPDACATFRTLYSAMAEFEQDLHRHIHLENNVLHPRALEMEG
jgi:regulator of cell morphogenesis and NO signaling